MGHSTQQGVLERFPEGPPTLALVEADSCRVVSENMQDHLSVAEIRQPARGLAKKSPSHPVALRFRGHGQKAQYCRVRWIGRCSRARIRHESETVEMSCSASDLPQRSMAELCSRPLCHAGCHIPVARSAGSDPQFYALVDVVFDSVADRVDSVADRKVTHGTSFRVRCRRRKITPLIHGGNTIPGSRARRCRKSEQLARALMIGPVATRGGSENSGERRDEAAGVGPSAGVSGLGSVAAVSEEDECVIDA